MKIAILYNFMDNIGGAEITMLILARELNADIYTTNIDFKKIKEMGFNIDTIHSIGKVPLIAPLKQELTYWKFRKLNLRKKYDFYIIAGDWAVSAVYNNNPHLWYLFSPTRELWDLYDYTRGIIEGWQSLLIFDFWVFFRRIINRIDSMKVKKIISISKNVQNRVKKYLKRESVIIYPPTETSKYKNKPQKEYWLSVNRLVDHKKVDIQIKAFSKIPEERLIIVGSLGNTDRIDKYSEYIRKIKPNNVEVLGWIDEKDLIELYSTCKGFITTSLDEDFGMTSVEAMASGKPVIAPNEGGYKETVINGKTGILIDDINPDKIITTIKQINGELKNNPNKYKEACIQQAKKFDTKIFIDKIKKEIESSIQNKK